jgi:leucyl-tRNA synthetase
MEGVEGCWRFINRIWRLFDVVHTKAEIPSSEKDKNDILRMMHQTIKKVTVDIEKKFQFNTAISSVMELVNALYTYKHHSNDGGTSAEVYKTVIFLMAPFTPHLCEEIWEKLGYKEYVSACPWPAFDESMTKQSSVELPVQINGKLRGKIIVSAEDGEDEVKKNIEKDEKIASQLKGRQIVKFIYVKGRIVTIFVK